jgi:hypothetical protein
MQAGTEGMLPAEQKDGIKTEFGVDGHPQLKGRLTDYVAPVARQAVDGERERLDLNWGASCCRDLLFVKHGKPPIA